MHVDLNLLTVLEALVEEGSVSGAAARLRLSAPAVSRSLGRIRRLTGDEILVRTGRTMTRTPYASAVRDQVGDLVRQAEGLLVPSGLLDLASLERVFTVRAHDALAATLAPVLLGDVLQRAPGVRLRFLAETTHDTDELRHAAVDLELGGAVPAAPELRHEVLGADPLAVVLRAGHPVAQRMDLAAYAGLPHVVVSRRGRLSDPVDEALSARGVSRSVVISVGTIAAAAQVIASSDAVLTAPGRVTASVRAAYGLVAVPVPVALPEPQVVSVWHQRSHGDAAHVWLRERVQAAMGGVLSLDPPRRDRAAE